MSDAVVLRALGLGDFLTAVPALRALRRALPDWEIALACPAALTPLVRACGAVDRIVETAPFVLDAVHFPGPDLAVNLHGCGPHSHEVLLANRPGRLVAFEHADVPESAGGPRWSADEHEVARWCRLLTENGFPANPDDLDLPRPPGPPVVEGAVVIHPGAATPGKRWPVRRWGTVARALSGWGGPLVVTGSTDEVDLAEHMGGTVLAGRTSLAELAGVVAAARLVLTGDTGVGHLATAYRTPSVVVFGPTSPAGWGPPPARQEHRALWAGSAGETPGEALLKISVADVLGAAEEVREGSR